MTRKKIIEIKCKCGLVWKVPASKGVGLCAYNFQCDGTQGCRRFMSISMKDDQMTDVFGAKSWSLVTKV